MTRLRRSSPDQRGWSRRRATRRKYRTADDRQAALERAVLRLPKE